MKKILIILALAQTSILFAQENREKEITSEVEKVMVFFNKAQVTRLKTVVLDPGKTTLKFGKLSPYINPKSLQANVKGEVTVLSVNHQLDYLESGEKSKAVLALEAKKESLLEAGKVERAHLSVIEEEIVFLQENRKIGGKNQELSVTNLKEASAFYSSRLTALKLEQIKRQNELARLNEELVKVRNQIAAQSAVGEEPVGEVLINLDAKKQESIQVELTYIVANAGWYPSYDIRARSIDDPLKIVYKANVHQDTKVEWKNVKLAFSSQNPSLSGSAPELKPYYLNFHSLPPSYRGIISEVSGVVTDNMMQGLPGVNVVVTGSSIGTVTDMQGRYSIAIPADAQRLTFSYIGYMQQELPIRNDVMNVVLQEDIISLDEVVVTGSARSRPEADVLQGHASGLAFSGSKKRLEKESSLAIPTVQIQNQTSVQFSIDMPYTVPSDNKNQVLTLTEYEVPASYEYYSVPKIDPSAFLIAYMENWEQYNLLEGEANIYFEGTYIGKSILDTRYMTDTLSISLGRDKSISVDRQKITDLTSRKFIGTKKEESRGWRISVKNNKAQEIKMVLLDQVPVPTTEAIELDVKDLSGGKRNAETGEIKWEFKLKPRDAKELELKYSLKYPKNQSINLE